MANIQKINRVLLIEKFCDNIASEKTKGTHPDNLYMALMDAVDDGKFDYRKVDIENLKVKNFEEFKNRFSPIIYQGWLHNGQEDYPVYSTEMREGFIPVSFDKNVFFNAAIDLYEKKKNSGSSNFDFDYSCFSLLVSPESSLKEIQNQRRQLNYSMMKMLEAKRDNNTSLAEAYAKKCWNIGQEATKKYNGNITALLALNIADMEVKLGLTDSANKSISSGADDKKIPEAFRIEFNDEGGLVKKKIATNINNNINPGLSLPDKASSQVKKLLTVQLKDNQSSDYNKELLISCFDKDNGLVNQQMDEEAKKAMMVRYNQFKAIYSASMENLLNSVNEIIEKMLDVKALFDNAEGEISVIVANSTASELAHPDVVDKFSSFLKNFNGNVDEKIWFAVLPQIDDNELVNTKPVMLRAIDSNSISNDEDEQDIIDVELDSNEDENINFDDVDWESYSDEGESNSKYTSIEVAKQLIEKLAEAKCMTFFGYKGCEATGFGCMNKAKLDAYISRLSTINSDYAVFSYPNFTLMSGIEAGNIPVAHDEYIKNPGLFIDAPYVAAGLVMKSLNSKVLKEKYKYKVKEELGKVCVRFDFESDEDEYKNRYAVCTNMNCEQLLKYEDELLKQIADKPFGFFFDYYGFYKGTKVKNAFVKCARTMSTKDNRIFATLVKDYIFLDAANGNIGISKATFDKYKENHKWRDTEYINNPLRDGDSYGYKEDENGTIKGFVHFANTSCDNFIDELEITE